MGDPFRIRGRRPASRPTVVAGVLAALVVTLALGSLAWPAAAPGSASTGAPATHAPSSIIIDRVTGRVLYGHDVHHQRPMASTTKIMTALIVVLRVRDLTRTVTAPAGVAYCSGIGLEPGERITIRQALLGLMVRSANDCGVTLATALAGSEPAFVGWMNAKARALGLRDTHYTNASGSVRDGRHHSSVYDLAKLGRYAMANAHFRDLCRRQRAVIRWGNGRELRVLANNLLLHFSWADGIKCGYTPVAGCCLVGSGMPGLRPFVTATLKAPRRDVDARDHVALFNWASTLYEKKTLVTSGDEVALVPVAGGGEVRVTAKSTLTRVVRSAAAVRTELVLPAAFEAVPPDGTVVGSVTYRADGVTLGTVRLVVVTPDPPPEEPPASPSPSGSPAPGASG